MQCRMTMRGPLYTILVLRIPPLLMTKLVGSGGPCFVHQPATPVVLRVTPGAGGHQRVHGVGPPRLRYPLFTIVVPHGLPMLIVKLFGSGGPHSKH
jgi:hypothetical protein